MEIDLADKICYCEIIYMAYGKNLQKCHRWWVYSGNSQRNPTQNSESTDHQEKLRSNAVSNSPRYSLSILWMLAVLLNSGRSQTDTKWAMISNNGHERKMVADRVRIFRFWSTRLLRHSRYQPWCRGNCVWFDFRSGNRWGRSPIKCQITSKYTHNIKQ